MGESNIDDTVLPPMTGISIGYALTETDLAFYSLSNLPEETFDARITISKEKK